MQFVVELPWSRLAELDRAHTAIVMPVGSIEQHGRHLPVGTDYLLMEKLVHSLAGFEPGSGTGILLPTLQFGQNSEHAHFPGTIGLDRPTLEQILAQQADAFYRHGFTRFILLNAHGGNFDWLDHFVRTYKMTREADVMSLDYLRGPLFKERRELFDNPVGMDIHAGEFETSLMLHLYPDLVDMARDAAELRECNVRSVQLPPGWLTHEVSRSGVMGDATLATAEKGKAYFELICRHVEERIAAYLGGRI